MQVEILKDQKVSDFEWLPDYQEIIACQESAADDSRPELLPPENLAMEERIYWKDYEYITQLLPLAARESWAAADAVLDRYEFEDSAIYMEYPDKVSMQRIADIVYETMRFYEERPVIRRNDGSEASNPYYCPKDGETVSSALKEMVFTITAWNISYRRQRYYRRRKVFSMG